MRDRRQEILDRANRNRNNPSNPGRRKYDHYIIAEELLDWSLNEDAISIAGFCAERGYLSELIWRFEIEFEEFSYAYHIAKMRLAERRERMLNEGVMHCATFQRYQGGYDPFLRKDEDNEKDKEAVRRRGIAEINHANLVELAKIMSEGKIKQAD